MKKLIILFAVTILPTFQAALYAGGDTSEKTTTSTSTSSSNNQNKPVYTKPVFPPHEKNHSLKLFLSKLQTGSLKEKKKLFKHLPSKMSQNEFMSILQQAQNSNTQNDLNVIIQPDDLNKIEGQYLLQNHNPQLKFQNPDHSLKSNGFDNNTSLAIFRTAQNIRKLSSSETLTIFVGRSPIWIARAYQILEEKVPLHNPFVHVHFSGKPDSMDYCNMDIHYLLTNLVTPERLEFYRNYLKGNGIFPGMHYKEIHLVDYLEEGEGIYQFARILKEWFEDENQVLPNLRILDMNRLSLLTNQKEGLYQSLVKTTDDNISDFQIHYHCVNAEIDGEDDYDDLMANEAFGVYFPAFKWTKEYQSEITNYIQDQETVSKMNSDLLHFYNQYITQNPEILEDNQKSFDEIEEEISLQKEFKESQENPLAEPSFQSSNELIDLPQELIDLLVSSEDFDLPPSKGNLESDEVVDSTTTDTNRIITQNIFLSPKRTLDDFQKSNLEDTSISKKSSYSKQPRKKRKTKK